MKWCSVMQYRGSLNTPRVTQILRLAILQRKLMSASCGGDHVLSVIAQSLWPEVRVGRSTGESRACWLNRFFTTDQYSDSITADATMIRLSILHSILVLTKHDAKTLDLLHLRHGDPTNTERASHLFQCVTNFAELTTHPLTYSLTKDFL